MIKMLINECKYEDILENSNSIMIIIENKKYFYNFIIDLQLSYSEINSIKLFDEKEKELKNTDYIEVIPSIFTMDINNKKNISALLKIIKTSNKELIQNNLIDINNKLEQFSNHLKLETDITFESNVDLSDDELLKALNIYIDYDKQSLLEMIYQYIKTTNELRNIKIFVFISLLDYLDDDELKLLLKNCKLLGVILINIEIKDNNFVGFHKKFILDKSLSLI